MLTVSSLALSSAAFGVEGKYAEALRCKGKPPIKGALVLSVTRKNVFTWPWCKRMLC